MTNSDIEVHRKKRWTFDFYENKYLLADFMKKSFFFTEYA